MRRLGNALAARLVSASIFGVGTPAIAQTYPVSLAGGIDNTLRCDYANLGQCQATASGGLGYCVDNPAMAQTPMRAMARNATGGRFEGSIIWFEQSMNGRFQPILRPLAEGITDR